jgi:hypothetical protein
MKRILAVVTAMFLLAFLTSMAPRGALAFGVKDVIAMSQYGIPDSLIIEKIRHSDTQFGLNARDLLELRAARVSDDVVVAMLRTEDRTRADIYYDGRYWPYDPQWYVGLNLGWYDRYAPVYVGRGYGYGYRGYGYGYRGYGRGRR